MNSGNDKKKKEIAVANRQEEGKLMRRNGGWQKVANLDRGDLPQPTRRDEASSLTSKRQETFLGFEGKRGEGDQERGGGGMKTGRG